MPFQNLHIGKTASQQQVTQYQQSIRYSETGQMKIVDNHQPITSKTALFGQNNPKMTLADYDAKDGMSLFSQNKFQKGAAQIGGFKTNLNSSVSKQNIGGHMPPITNSAQQIQNMQNYIQKAQKNQTQMMNVPQFSISGTNDQPVRENHFQGITSVRRYPNIVMMATTENYSAQQVWDMMKEKGTMRIWDNYEDVQATEDWYWKTRGLFWDGSINLDSMPKEIQLYAYGLSNQAKFGDNKEEKQPSLIRDIKGHYKWKFYEKQKGRPRTDARKDFLELAEAIWAADSPHTELQEEGKAFFKKMRAKRNINVNPDWVEDYNYRQE